MRNSKILYFILLLAFLNSCGNNRTEELIINNVGTSQKQEVDFDLAEGKNVNKIYLKVKGQLSDTAKIRNYYILPGEVDTTFKHDWYAPEYIVDYQSNKNNQGKLALEIEFVVF